MHHAHVLWVDCNGDAAVEALRSFEPAPSIVVASGSGANCHAYWPLTAPLAADELERANRRLAHALGADPASADVELARYAISIGERVSGPCPFLAEREEAER